MTKQSVFASLVEEAGFGQDADEGITTLPLSSLIVPETPKNPKELVQLRKFCQQNKLQEAKVTSIDMQKEVESDHIKIEFVPASLHCYTVGYNLVENKLKGLL